MPVINKTIKKVTKIESLFLHALMAILCLAITFNANAKSQDSQSRQNSQKYNTPKPTIIALSPHVVEMLFDIGAGSQIIGTTDFSDYPEQAKEITRVGNYLRIQLESVIALKPDLIIAWKTGSPSDDISRLKKLGFNIVYSNPKQLSDISKELRYFGQLTGRVKQANLVADKFDSDLKVIKETYLGKKELIGFYELWDNPLTTVSKDSWPQQFFDICRVINPFENVSASYPQINIEEVLKEQVEIIVQPLSINQTDKKGFNWHKWPVIPAVKHKHVIKTDADALHRMTLRNLNALEVLCEDIDQVRKSLTTHL